ncbi:YaeQ family protein [Yersinia nurmii]|uniref:YaeQ family protein n=1 Tax=Yersinia nurmii TaxID=685706 RepID=A0AAW7K307_9GAMM|nr:YaeQ family protein [Yersinia nurmii]MDN0087640.1 YaeQ family protein [Yersinia nurmii]CNE87707.1 yaeq protein [Yersinia nurmii]
MALKATIHKATVNIADMDRNVFMDTNLTVAQHPSETDQRMMLRLLAWICHADERLLFTKGLSADDEPEIWLRNDHNGIELWVELGLPDEKRLRKACNQSKKVVLYSYGERAAKVWWPQVKEKLSGHENLQVRFLDDEQMTKLAAMSTRNMNLQATLQEGTIWLSDAQNNLEITFSEWQGSEQ